MPSTLKFAEFLSNLLIFFFLKSTFLKVAKVQGINRSLRLQMYYPKRGSQDHGRAGIAGSVRSTDGKEETTEEVKD